MSAKYTGIVASGKGEGDYYVSRYNPKFKQFLGTEFYPGTLNLIGSKIIFPEKYTIVKSDEYYRDVKCYKVRINNEVTGFVVVPQVLKRDDNVIEIVSESYLRGHMNLKDGDKLEIEFLED